MFCNIGSQTWNKEKTISKDLYIALGVFWISYVSDATIDIANWSHVLLLTYVYYISTIYYRVLAEIRFLKSGVTLFTKLNPISSFSRLSNEIPCILVAHGAAKFEVKKEEKVRKNMAKMQPLDLCIENLHTGVPSYWKFMDIWNQLVYQKNLL